MLNLANKQTNKQTNKCVLCSDCVPGRMFFYTSISPPSNIPLAVAPLPPIQRQINLLFLNINPQNADVLNRLIIIY